MPESDGSGVALRQLSDDDLVRLRTAADSSPDVVPGLLAYLDYAGDWEQHRRRGVDLAVQSPMAAIEDVETLAGCAGGARRTVQNKREGCHCIAV